MSNVDDISKLKMDPKTTLKASDIHVHDFSFTGNTASTVNDDILEKMSRSAHRAARSQSQSESSIRMGAVDVDFSSLRADLGDDGPEGPALREAKRLVNEQQYETALDKLEEVFQIIPHHHEAVYLQAYCQFQLKRLKEALQTVYRLKDVVLSNRLQTRVRSLKVDIRSQTVPQAARVYTAAVKTRDVSRPIQKLREFAAADPEVGNFHHFLASVLVVGKQLDEARTAAAHGLEVCETDREELEQLLREIEKRFLPRILRPARTQFREKKYAQASATLAALSADVKTTALWESFNGYVDQLTGKGKKNGGLFSRFKAGSINARENPPGTPAEVRELFEYLVEPEMKAARIAVEKPDYTAAERALTSAVAIAPGFSIANHMLATCLYKRVGASVKQKIGKDLDDAGAKQLRRCKERLDEARGYAAACKRDPDIPDGQLLLNSIDQMRKDIDEVVTRHETQSHDAKLVNKAIEEFIPVLVKIIMLNNAKTPHEIRRLAEDLYSNLQRLRSELPSLKRQCKGAQAKQIMDLVRTKFVEPNYKTLRRAMNR